MPIKQRDGKVYKLTGPNPLMDKQEFWDEGHITLLNFHWEPIVIENTRVNNQKPLQGFNNISVKNQPTPKEPTIEDLGKNVAVLTKEEQPEPKKKKKKKKRPLIDELIQTKPIPVPPPPPVVAEQPKETQKVDPKIAKLLDKHKKMFHCVPAIKKQTRHKDPLYGTESIIEVDGFGSKSQFAGVILDESIMEILFWTSEKLSLKSIIFPQNGSKACWQVDRVEEQPVGFMYHGIPSSISPDFSG